MSVVGRSLYARVVSRLVLVLVAAGTVLVVAAWFYARLAADDAYDRVLVRGALQIAENTWLKNGVLNVDVPVSAFAFAPEGDHAFYKVIDPAGRVVAGDPGLEVVIPWPLLKQGPVLRSARHNGEAVRVALVGREMFDSDSRGWAAIVLAETEGARQGLAASLTLKVLVAVLTMGVITIVGAMLAARQALIPLTRLESAIRQRDPTSLTPLDVEAPREAEALVNAINDFIKRLDSRIALMRRVIGDVAHQIRTPITAAMSQLALLDMQQTDDGRRRQLGRVNERLSDLGALVQQLVNHAMVLHRADGGSFAPVDVISLVRKEMTTLLSSESPRDIEVSLEADAEPLWVHGDAVMLREAVRNVLGNALRYGARTRLVVAVTNDLGEVRMDVLDDGPGIPIERWNTVRQPFNPRNDERNGASLGLAIVDEVLKAHQGTMEFSFTAHGEFSVCLRIPMRGALLSVIAP